MMNDREDEELQMALRMSLQGSPRSPPEAKRSKPPRESGEETTETKARRSQRELMAAAAEKRLRAASVSPVGNKGGGPAKPASADGEGAVPSKSATAKDLSATFVKEGLVGASSFEVVVQRGEFKFSEELSLVDAEQLFLVMFGNSVSKNVLMRWTNQGIRFSPDPETFLGLVQHEGGPCGVLATIQAFVLKYLLFLPDDTDKMEVENPLYTLRHKRCHENTYSASIDFASITEDRKTRALIRSMVEILFLCGSGKEATVATIGTERSHVADMSEADQNEMGIKTLDGISIESASDMQKVLRVNKYTSRIDAFHYLMESLPMFQSRFGALLFLISALLSRGLEFVQEDRDDPSQPLVTAPFGHASQEIVNLLICGQAVPNVFDDRMDLGGGMFLKGIPTTVEVGFLTLLESLNFCKVGQHLKCPKWPIWVVGSESHYTVLFALDVSVQEENKLEERESKIRRAFDAQDQSGGGGFISVEGFQHVLRETNISFPPDKLQNLCCAGFIVWSEFWQALQDLDKSLGGLKDSSGSLGKKQFDIYHFNGIAKSVSNTAATVGGSDSPVQRPRLCKLSVTVPPRWTPEDYLADVVSTASSEPVWRDSDISELNQPEPPQHAPLVDCIRTRWPRAICNWVGDAPSIV